MENVYSALVLYALNKDITEDAISSVVSAAGGEPDAAQIKTLVTAVGELNIKDVLASAAVMAAAPVAAAPAAAAPAEGGKKEKKEKEKEEKVEEPVGLDALFG
jgi:large subunit ribosomal protein L12